MNVPVERIALPTLEHVQIHHLRCDSFLLFLFYYFTFLFYTVCVDTCTFVPLHTTTTPPRSFDGKTVNTRVLSMKRKVGITEQIYGKRMKTPVTDSCRQKLAALIAMAPKCNGSGDF